MSTHTHRAPKRVLLTEMAALATPAGFLALGPEKSKHLKTVLRVEKGAPLTLTDGRGRLYEGTFDYEGDRAGVRVGSSLAAEAKPAATELVLCLPKNATMDWVVEKAVECGVTRITPVVSSRSVVKPDPKELEKYVRRWQAIMDGAVEQCERLWRPEIAAPMTWKNWCAEPAQTDASIAFVSELRAEGTADLSQARKLLEGVFSKGAAKNCRVLIGPEGGLAREEREDLKKIGFQEASLGRTVLRVETAAIAVLMLVQVSRSCFADSSHE